MKNILFFFCFFSFLKFYSQKIYTNKAIYELIYKTDSTEDYKKSQMVLFLNDNKESFFQDYKRFRNDSLKSSQTVTVGVSAFIGETVSVNNIDQKIIISRKFDNTNLYYVELIPNQWSIKNRESTINGVKCREATLKAYGRNWKACYSEDYPFQFGPYLFAGLPGLILSVEDDQRFYQFKLQSLKKENSIIKENNKGIEVPKEKFYQMVYDVDFSGSFFNNFRMSDSNEQERLKKKYIDAKKRQNTYPIDKSMRYLFDK